MIAAAFFFLLLAGGALWANTLAGTTWLKFVTLAISLASVAVGAYLALRSAGVLR